MADGPGTVAARLGMFELKIPPMLKLAIIAIFVLVASGLSAGQASASTAAVERGSIGATAASQTDQTDNGNGEIPTFHAQARQVLVTVAVWKDAPKSTAWVPNEVLKRFSTILAMPPIARGLSANDFHVFENGAEQKVNYLQESDLPVRDASKQWFFHPQVRGTWGESFDTIVGLTAPIATYTIGYSPPLSQAGDCRTIRVVAGNDAVVMNRDHYCTADHGDPEAREGNGLAVRMEQFAKSGKRGAFKVSSRSFVFWSSRVLSLLRDNTSGVGPAPPGAATDTYVVVVHDSRAPATVQIATEYELGTTDPGELKSWHYPCRRNSAIYVLGIIYRANEEISTRFGDSYSCVNAGSASQTLMNYGYGSESRARVLIPTRFNSQVQLRPGDYDLHVVVSDGHKFGQARMPLHVEPLESQSLAMSDLAVNGIVRDASWILRDAGLVSPAPLNPSPLVSKDAQFIPVPGSRIPKKNRLPLYFEIYEPLLADQNPQIYFRMKITDLKSGMVVMNTEPTSAAPCVTPGNVVVPVALDVETEKLPKGHYKLEVQASDSAGRKTEWKQGTFSIE